ncbi:MAG: hypothetical protein A2Y38_07270 [Spirochaetes bacterium GWB1_59_5]|nr:MAG: hypothetical protein A2Y38_07270 [Spirochaetes bacterium GWB1_59_5]
MTTATATQAHRPLTPEQYEQRRREFHEATAPITKAMGDLLLLQPFRLTVTLGELPKRETLWIQGHKELFDQYAEMVDWYAQRILGRTP